MSDPVDNMNGVMADVPAPPMLAPGQDAPEPIPIQPAPIPSTNQPQVAEMVYTNPQSEVQQLASVGPVQGAADADVTELASPTSGQSALPPEIVGEKCRGAPGLDSQPLVVSWDTVKKVVFHHEEKRLKTSATIKPKAEDVAGSGISQSFKQSPGLSGKASPARVQESENLQGFDVKRDHITVVIGQEQEKQHSKMMQYLHHMQDVSVKREVSRVKSVSKQDSVTSKVEEPEPIPDDEELEIQRSVLHLKAGFVKSDKPDSLWDNFEIVSTHIAVEDGQPTGECTGFGGAGAVLKRMNMAFNGPSLVSAPVAVSADYRFGASVTGRKVTVRMLTGGAVLCAFDLGADEDVTMLNFAPAGDILIGVMRKNNTSYIKVWSVITSDTLKVLDDESIFPSGCLALASISSDKTQIFVVVAKKTGVFDLVAYSLAATSPTKELKIDDTASEQDVAVTAASAAPSLPFNPYQFFMFECAQDEDSGGWQWKSLLRHRVSDTASQDKATVAANALLMNMKKEEAGGMGMVSSDENLGVFCQVFSKKPEHGIHHFDELEANTGMDRKEGPKRNVIQLADKKAKGKFATCVPNECTVVLWDDAGELCHLWSHKRRITCIDVSKDGAVVVVGVSGKDEASGNQQIEMARVIIYSLITLEEIYSYVLPMDVTVAKLDYAAPNRRLVVKDLRGWKQLRLDEMETIPSLTGGPGNRMSMQAHNRAQIKTSYPDSIAITNDGFFFFSMKTVGRGENKKQELTLGAVGQSNVRTFYIAPKTDMSKFRAQSNPGTHGNEIRVWCVCISGWGNSIGVGLTHRRKGEKKQHYVVVMSASSLEVLMVASLDVEPRAICIEQEQVSVMGDNAQPASYAEKESVIITFSAITGSESGKGRHKVVGRTLGLTAGGAQRVAQSEDGRISIEQLDSGETIFQIQDRTLTFKGIGAGGKLLALVRPDEFESPGLFLKDINNMDRFGPSLETCNLWFQPAGGGDIKAADVQITLSRYKHGLPKWPLLFLDDWSQVFTLLLQLCVQDRDYGPFKVLLESCPHFWAGTKFIDEKEDTGPEEKKKGLLGIDMPKAGDIKPPIPVKIPKLPGLARNNSDAGQGGDAVKKMVRDSKTYWKKALENNDKIFVQMLLDGVIEMVSAAETVPVREMEQVTAFLVDSIKANKMQEKVEAFLLELPLLPVPNKFHNDKVEDILTDFPDGEVINSAWSARSAPLSATAFSYKADEVAEGKGERGYRYVSALPGLTKMETLEAFTSSNASPALVDNETMRATIDALEETTSEVVFGFACDLTLMPFILTLICFCLMVFFCVTADVSFAQLIEGRAEQFGLVMGCFAVVGHIIFLYFEFIEFKTLSGPWWTKTTEYFSGGFWNILPFLGNVMGIITFLLVVNDGSKVQIRSVAAFSMIFLWFNLFNYLRAYRKGSALVKMLIEIMVDMGYFVGVVLVLLLSFAGGFYALHGKLNPVELGVQPQDGNSEPDDNVFEDLSDAFANTFLSAVLGALDVDQFRSPLDLSRDETGALTNISFFFYFLLVILVTVVALNALIAIMGSTYGRVEEAQQAVTYQEIASIIHDKLRFRHFHLHGAKEKFERDNRWTHVLSPSESGSMPQARAISKGGQNPVVALKKDIRDNQNRTEGELNKLQELLRAQEEAMGELDTNVDSEALNEAVEQIGALPSEVREIKHNISDIQTQIDPENQNDVPSWAKQLMAAVAGGGGLGRGGGDGLQTLRELNDVKQQLISLRSELEAQWGAYNDMRVRLDAHGLQTRSQTASTARPAGPATRSVRAAAQASTSSPARGGGDSPMAPGGGNLV